MDGAIFTSSHVLIVFGHPLGNVVHRNLWLRPPPVWA
jgi:hypothetical protein